MIATRPQTEPKTQWREASAFISLLTYLPLSVPLIAFYVITGHTNMILDVRLNAAFGSELFPTEFTLVLLYLHMNSLMN